MLTIPKKSLVDKCYYYGNSRNGIIARWFEKEQRFVYWRSKFNSLFLTSLPHVEDQRGFDYFEPYRVIPSWQIIEVPLDQEYSWDG